MKLNKINHLPHSPKLIIILHACNFYCPALNFQSVLVMQLEGNLNFRKQRVKPSFRRISCKKSSPIYFPLLKCNTKFRYNESICYSTEKRAPLLFDSFPLLFNQKKLTFHYQSSRKSILQNQLCCRIIVNIALYAIFSL